MKKYYIKGTVKIRAEVFPLLREEGVELTPCRQGQFTGDYESFYVPCELYERLDVKLGTAMCPTVVKLKGD